MSTCANCSNHYPVPKDPFNFEALRNEPFCHSEHNFSWYAKAYTSPEQPACEHFASEDD